MGVEPPKEGDLWRGNFGRIHLTANGNLERSIWSALDSTKNMDDRKAFGAIAFQGELKSGTSSSKHPHQTWREKHYAKTFDVPAEWKGKGIRILFGS